MIEKVSLEKVVNSVSALNKLSEMSLDPKLSYWIARLNDKISSALKGYNEYLKVLHDKHATAYQKVDQNGKPIFDEDGNPVMELAIRYNTPQFQAFEDERKAFTDDPDNDISLDMKKVKVSLFLNQKDNPPQFVFNALYWCLEDDLEEN